MDVTVIAGALVASAGGVYALLRLGKAAWRANRRLVRAVDMVPRMAALTEELSPNSGHSIKDQVAATAATAARTESKVDDVGRRLDDHIRNHPGG